jgi:hypothetical protein
MRDGTGFMIVLIQCAASKRPGAGHLVSASGKPVVFVAHPEIAPANDRHLYARPDDRSENGKPWRQVLEEYNAHPEQNPLGLYRAYQLYKNRIYKRLVDRFGIEKVYILSAGWGLVQADFLTPYYDITFSRVAEPYKRRKKADRYQDFRMLPDQTVEEIVFFGGSDYLVFFVKLTGTIRSKKTVFYNSIYAPQAAGCVLKRYDTIKRTNWHYDCANAFLDGR